jgi:hypothetical protein
MDMGMGMGMGMAPRMTLVGLERTGMEQGGAGRDWGVGRMQG